ncbi:hypothetical protein BZA70DRAFT_301541 [Myxozyma melibiosi]|uniref:Cytochrome b mRNA-processing protein 4 n=1 Tax=Myxozyma melibiosi TaxID=54550 RepID=A0ABR1FER8_9ASCO
MSTLMYLKMLFVGGGITGLGVGLYKNAVPTEEELLKEFSPALQQKYHQENQYMDRDSANAQLRNLIQSNANSSRPAWMLTDKIEPRCVTHERDRVRWSQRSLERARESARRRMLEEKERLEREEQQQRRRSFF